MQHIYFSGIGGTGIGALALIAKDAGYEVSGSDKQNSDYLSNLRTKGITDIHVGQTAEAIDQVHRQHPIDWVVYSSAVPKENPDHPELNYAKDKAIPCTKRDEFLQKLLNDTQKKLIAIAGTHGKTTTTAMMIWLVKQLGLPVSYSVGAKLSFGGLGEFDPKSDYFIYEADEYDRNFLSFYPEIAAIPGIDWDHPDIYPTREEYYQAFIDFIQQSKKTVLWQVDGEKIAVSASDNITLLANDTALTHIHLPGRVNRINAHLVVVTAEKLGLCSYDAGIEIINRFPGVSRRFEKIADHLYSDYAHTPPKIRGALQLAEEVAGKSIVVVYEGLHNTRQHFIRDELKDLFKKVKKLYIVPSYLAREDQSLELLTPEKLCMLMEKPHDREPAALDSALESALRRHTENGDTVLCITAGGGGSLDEWLRKTFGTQKV